MKIYQIDSSARKEGSTSRALAKKLLDKIKKPEDEIVYRDLDDEMVFVSGLTESGMKIEKKDFPDYYQILTEVKVRFQFIDKNVVLEDWAEMIKLDENENFKQVRFSPRLDFVPLLEKEKLELYYLARKKISEFYNSNKYKIEFKLFPGDLLMMDNYRLLHGRTSYNASEGDRFLQGCYIDYDSTEGKLKHLKRKFNL